MAATQANVVTDAQVAFYQQNGYVQIDGILSLEEVEELRALTDEMNAEVQKTLPPLDQRNKYQQVFLQVVNVWRRDERFRKFTFHPRLAQAARSLIGAEKVRLWHDHLMTKLPGPSGRQTDWHQDFPYWPIAEPGPMSVWIPMQDVDLEMGCMHFVPGSHEWGIDQAIMLDREEAGDLFDLVKDKPAEEIRRVYVPLKKGSVTFHNGLTFHFAGKNYSEMARRVLSVIYMADGSTYVPRERPPGYNTDGVKVHPVTDEAGYLNTGDKFGGEYFPIIE